MRKSFNFNCPIYIDPPSLNKDPILPPLTQMWIDLLSSNTHTVHDLSLVDFYRQHYLSLSSLWFVKYYSALFFLLETSIMLSLNCFLNGRLALSQIDMLFSKNKRNKDVAYMCICCGLNPVILPMHTLETPSDWVLHIIQRVHMLWIIIIFCWRVI